VQGVIDNSLELRCSPQQNMFPTGGGGEGGGEAAVQTELAPLGAAVRVQHSAADCCTVAPTGKHLQQVGRQLGGEASWACRAIVTLWQLQGQKTAAGNTHTQYGPNA
jgi:glycine cleavage system protein P-like pyridoxal-binding family